MQPVSLKLSEGHAIGSRSGRSRDVSASELLVRNIIRGLYEGRYAPGQRLVEVDLSQEYAVSRFVVREALGRLLAEGVVSTSFNRGAVIPRLSRKQAIDAHLVMEKLFSLAARLAAENITAAPGNRELLIGSVEHLSTFQDVENYDFFEFGRSCSQFFRSISKISDNQQLQRVISSLHIHLLRAQFRGYPTVAEVRRLPELKAIAGSILAGDSEQAGARMSEYFRSLSNDVAALPDRVFA